MNDEYEQLRAALNAGPTPGPWFADEHGKIWRRNPNELCENGGGVAGDRALATANVGWHGEGCVGFPAKVNARLIAAANPDTIRALLADHDQWRQQAWHSTDVADAAIERVKELEAERDRMREALRWTAATLQHAVYGQRRLYASDKITIIAADGEKRTVEQILDAADAALAQEGS